MSKKCRAYSESRLGLEPSDNRKAFYAGWDAAIHSALSEQPAQQQEPVACVNGCQGFFKHSPQPAQRKPLTDDPLQGAVDWLLEADGEYFCTATVQRTLRIGYNRAKRLCDTAKERAAHGIKGDA